MGSEPEISAEGQRATEPGAGTTDRNSMFNVVNPGEERVSEFERPVLWIPFLLIKKMDNHL